MSEKVVILGGGIGGMTVAHELAHCAPGKYEIHVYEQYERLGGMARSSYKERNGYRLPTEYSWRVYGPYYNNLRQIFKQIPINEPGKSVHDNLVDIKEILMVDRNGVFRTNNRVQMLFDIFKALKKVPWMQKWKTIKKLLYCSMISTDRLDKMDCLSWNEFINPGNSLHHDLRKYIVDMTAPYFGVDSSKVNVPSVVKTIETIKFNNRPLSVMKGPTNEVWFDPWKKYLETKGVVFHLNSEVTDIKTDKDKVTSVRFADDSEVFADHYFCGLSVESVAKMPSLNIPGLSELASLGHQLMTTIQLYLDEKFTLEVKETAIYLPDSPWQLVIEPEALIWNRSYGDIKGILSVGLCDYIRPGILIKKPFTECSYEEIKEEVWHQITSSKLSSYLDLSKINIVDYNVWDTYIFDRSKLTTLEPKFSPNKGTLPLRPNNVTKYRNFYFATAYTKTETDMFEMEGAAESGRRAARMIEPAVVVFPSHRPIFFAPYRRIDRLFPKLDIYSYSPFLAFCLGLPLICLVPFIHLYYYLFRNRG